MDLSISEFALYVLVFVVVIVGLAGWVYYEGSALATTMQRRLNSVILDRNQLAAKYSVLLTKFEKKSEELKNFLEKSKKQAAPSQVEVKTEKVVSEENKEELERLKKEFNLAEKFSNELQEQVKDRDDELALKLSEIKDLNKKLKQVQKDKDNELAIKLSEIKDLNKELKQLEKNRDDNRKLDLQAKKESQSHLKLENKKLTQKIKELSFQMNNIEKSHAKDIDQLLIKVEKDKNVLREKHARKIRKLRSENPKYEAPAPQSENGAFEKKVVQRVLKSYKKIMSLEKENIGLKKQLKDKNNQISQSNLVNEYAKMSLMERATLTLWNWKNSDEKMDKDQIEEIKQQIDEARSQIHELQTETAQDNEKTVA